MLEDKKEAHASFLFAIVNSPFQWLL